MDALRDECAFRSCVRAFDRVLGAGLQGLGWSSVLALGRASFAFVWAFVSGCVPVLEGAFGVVAPRAPVSGGTVVACGPILEGPCDFGPVPALGCGHGLGCAGVPGPACALGCDEGCQAPACDFGPAPALGCGHGLGWVGAPGPACAPLPRVVAGVPVLLGVVVGPCAHMPVWAVPACAPGWAGVPWTPVPNCAVGVHMGPWAVGASCPAPCCPIGACGAAPAWAGVGVGFCRGFISVMQCVQNVAPSSS